MSMGGNLQGRLCISSVSGSGGKTLLTLGLGRILANRALRVKPFKKGPDYIDAAWLSLACRTPATNLDLFFMDAESLRHLFARSMLEKDFALIEGNRGLYDGLDETGSCSTAALARALKTPILLCLDCSKTTRTMAAVIRGLISFEQGLRFGGVILNRIGSSRHESALRVSIETHTGLPVLGALPRLKNNPIPERHMGLASKGGHLASDAEQILDNLATHIADNCDIDKILDASVSPLPEEKNAAQISAIYIKNNPRIGYVHDEALWFYYPENLQALKNCGAELVRLSLLDKSEKNRAAWQNLAGLYLGGGFPEDLPEQLSQSPYLPLLKDFSNHGMPIYAECGGLMILCSALERNNRLWPMAGIFPYIVRWRPKPQGLGYVEAKVVRANPFFPDSLTLRGHEFHYSWCDMADNTPDCCLKLARGKGLLEKNGHAFDGLLNRNTWASYTHIFAPALPCWANNFVLAAKGDNSVANNALRYPLL